MSGRAQGNPVEGGRQPQLQVDDLATKVANGEIGKMEILHIPSRVLTRTAITPDMVERQFDYRLTIRDVRDWILQKKLVAALKSVKVQPQPEMTDLRWGAVFYGVDGTRIGAVYFDIWGKKGAVDSTPVSFSGDLFKWLNRNFLNCFR